MLERVWRKWNPPTLHCWWEHKLIQPLHWWPEYFARYIIWTNKKSSTGFEKISYTHKNRKEETGIHTNLTKKCHLVQYESRGKNGPDQRQSILLRPNWQYIFTPALSQNGFNVAYKDIWDKWREHKRCENKKENNGKNTEWIIAKKYTL